MPHDMGRKTILSGHIALHVQHFWTGSPQSFVRAGRLPSQLDKAVESNAPSMNLCSGGDIELHCAGISLVINPCASKTLWYVGPLDFPKLIFTVQLGSMLIGSF